MLNKYVANQEGKTLKIFLIEEINDYLTVTDCFVGFL
jgi:hypothetical protein